jgi:hypothetical protein
MRVPLGGQVTGGNVALAFPQIQVLTDLRRSGVFNGAFPRVLELGEQNWYGDVNPWELPLIHQALGGSPEQVAETKETIGRILSGDPGAGSFELAKLFYRLVFQYETYSAIDLHGTAIAQRHDLNHPVPIAQTFDVVTNLGTSEHVFNQYQFFKTMHDLTAANGVMIHSMPNQGCYDHGFFNYHPTFLFDLAEANGYTMLVTALVDASMTPATLSPLTRESYVQMAVEGKLSHYSALFAVLVKPPVGKPFSVPRQGYYAGGLPPALADAWNKLPR